MGDNQDLCVTGVIRLAGGRGVRYNREVISLLLFLACADWFVWDTGGKRPGHGNGGDDTGTSTSDTGGFCQQDLPNDAPGGPDCVTDTIQCGQTIKGTTGGGSTVFDQSLYDGWFCGYPYPSDYEGAERVFLLDIDGRSNVDLDLDSECSEVDILSIHFEDDRCPYEGIPISECDSSWDDGDDLLHLYTDGDTRFYVIVESRSGKATNFRLTVNCTAL